MVDPSGSNWDLTALPLALRTSSGTLPSRRSGSHCHHSRRTQKACIAQRQGGSTRAERTPSRVPPTWAPGSQRFLKRQEKATIQASCKFRNFEDHNETDKMKAALLNTEFVGLGRRCATINRFPFTAKEQLVHFRLCCALVDCS